MKKLIPLCISLALASAVSANPLDGIVEGDIMQNNAGPSFAASVQSAQAEALTVDTVGDVDSFGRAKTYLGIKTTKTVTLRPDCTGSDPDAEVCIVPNAAPAGTVVDENDLAVFELPGKASNSLLCFTVTPVVDWTYENNTGATQTANMTLRTTFQIESDVLIGLNDPDGVPFNGSLYPAPRSLITNFEIKTIPDGHFEFEAQRLTRSCIAGLMSERTLVDQFGLSEADAKEMFKQPMTVSFGVRGNTAMVSDANFAAGIRLYGD